MNNKTKAGTSMYNSGRTEQQKYSGMTGSVTRVVLTGHKNSVVSVSYDSESGSLLSSSDDGSVRLWDIRTKNASVRLYRIPHNDGDVGTCRKIGKLVTVCRGDSLFGFDMRSTESVIVATPSWTYKCSNSDDDINDYGVSPCGSSLAIPTDNGDIEVLSLSTFQREHTFANAHSNIASVARYLPNRNNIVSAGYDCYINNYKVEDTICKMDKKVAVGSLIPLGEEETGSSNQSVNPPFGACLEVSTPDSDNNSQIALALRGDKPQGRMMACTTATSCFAMSLGLSARANKVGVI
jgi:WD40 repeat protein